MKQSDIVRVTGIGKSAISQYLSGDFEPKQRNIYLISQALNVSEAWLMGFDVPMERGKLGTDSSDELWRKICADEDKYKLTKWIAGLDQKDLNRIQKILDAVELLPEK